MARVLRSTIALVALAMACAPPTVKPPPATESIGGAGTSNAEGTADDGIHGALHKDHVGAILFSGTRLADDAPADAPLVTEINLGDRVYAKAFFARSPAHQLQKESAACGPSASGWWERTIAIDGKVEATVGSAMETGPEYEKQTAAIVDLAGMDPDRPMIWPNFREELPVTWNLVNASDGTHTVEITFGARCRQPKTANDPFVVLAKGSLAVKVTAKNRAAFAAAVGPFPPDAAFKSAADLKQIVPAAQRNYTGLFLEIRGLEDEWKVTSENGTPVVRRMPAFLAVRNPPNCTFQGVEVVEDWISGKWSAPSFQNLKDTRFDPQTVSCTILQAKAPKPK
jgi:hypothetical protein